MRITQHIATCCLSTFLVSCSPNAAETSGTIDTASFEYLPTTADVFISRAVGDSINAAIERLDSNMFSDGRTYNQAVDTLLGRWVVADAEHKGGSNWGSTYFNDEYFNDKIYASVSTEYDKASLKLLKVWEKSSEHGSTELVWSYALKIRVNYLVSVDKERYEGEFYQNSQINSPFDLQR